jgi:hypothetical protein
MSSSVARRSTTCSPRRTRPSTRTGLDPDHGRHVPAPQRRLPERAGKGTFLDAVKDAQAKTVADLKAKGLKVRTA